jgi:hypothetical protein
MSAPLVTPYGTEVAILPSESFNVGSLRNAIVVPGNIVVAGWTVYSTKASSQFLNVFDANTVPADASVPLFSWPLAANNGVGFAFPGNGRRFKTGLVLCNSSTDATKTIGSADCFFDVQYNTVSGGNLLGFGTEE